MGVGVSVRLLGRFKTKLVYKLKLVVCIYEDNISDTSNYKYIMTPNGCAGGLLLAKLSVYSACGQGLAKTMLHIDFKCSMY